MKREDRAELLDLFSAAASGTLDQQGLERLKKRLAGSAEARRLWFVFQDLEVGLGKLAVEQQQAERSAGFAAMLQQTEESPAPTGGGSAVTVAASQREWWGRHQSYVATAALIFAVAFALFFWGPQALHRGASSPSEMVAVDGIAEMICCVNCQWEQIPKVVGAESARLVGDGSRLGAGTLHLLSGSSVIRFDSGASMILSADTILDLKSKGSARLRRGEATVHAPDEAYGFTLQTPSGEIVDLGTEFFVGVDAAGATDLKVLEGEVESRSKNNQFEPQLLVEGEAVRYDAEGELRSHGQFAGARRFQDLLAEITDRRATRALIAFEPFNYRSGSMEASRANGGSGWEGPWRVREGEEVVNQPDFSNDMQIQPLPATSTASSNMAWQLPAGVTYRLRQFAQPIDFGRDDEYYFSFVAGRVESAHEVPGRRRTPAFRLTMRSDEDYWGPSLSIRLSRGMRPQIGLDGPTAGFTSPARYQPGQMLLWVGKIVTRRDGPDEAYLRVYGPDEPVDPIEPRLWSVTTEPFDFNSKLDLIIVTGVGLQSHWIDEIRVGKSWQAVTPVLSPAEQK